MVGGSNEKPRKNRSFSYKLEDSNFNIPQSGKWNLYVSIGNKKLPPISIEITNKEEKVSPMKT